MLNFIQHNAKLNLNHAWHSRFNIYVGYGLLLLGLASAILLTVAMQQLNQQALSLNNQMGDLKHPRITSRELTLNQLAQSPQKTPKLQEAIAEINFLWELLFSAIESLQNKKVKLLTLEPLPKQARIRISAEAANTQDMLDYVAQLSQLTVLKDVSLISHEQENNAENPHITFKVNAIWRIL